MYLYGKTHNFFIFTDFIFRESIDVNSDLEKIPAKKAAKIPTAGSYFFINFFQFQK